MSWQSYQEKHNEATLFCNNWGDFMRLWAFHLVASNKAIKLSILGTVKA